MNNHISKQFRSYFGSSQFGLTSQAAAFSSTLEKGLACSAEDKLRGSLVVLRNAGLTAADRKAAIRRSVELYWQVGSSTLAVADDSGESISDSHDLATLSELTAFAEFSHECKQQLHAPLPGALGNDVRNLVRARGAAAHPVPRHKLTRVTQQLNELIGAGKTSDSLQASGSCQTEVSFPPCCLVHCGLGLPVRMDPNHLPSRTLQLQSSNESAFEGRDCSLPTEKLENVSKPGDISNAKSTPGDVGAIEILGIPTWRTALQSAFLGPIFPPRTVTPLSWSQPLCRRMSTRYRDLASSIQMQHRQAASTLQLLLLHAA